jgi:hypothetical protein
MKIHKDEERARRKTRNMVSKMGWLATEKQQTNGAPLRSGLRHMPFGHVTICGNVV